MRTIFCILSFIALTLSPFSLSRASDIESLLMPGPVIKGHVKFETECTKCHQLFNKLSEKELCMDCHDKVAGDVKNKKGFHGLNTNARQSECRQCHTEHLGRNGDIVQLNKMAFDHDMSDFPLKGKHKNTICNLCHLPEKKFREAPSKCYDCHKDNDPHKGELGKVCNDCHKEDSWGKSKFDHDKTDFPLKGKHKDTSCVSCHINQRYENTPAKCYSCHLLDDIHGKSHEKKCETCHNPKEWESIKFDHDKTDFPLKGKHKDATCRSCHKENEYKDEPDKKCYSCHKNDDSHKGRNGKECKDCHSPKRWNRVSFKHDEDTDFPLMGKHKKVDCISCHKGTIGKDKLKTNCASCHILDDVHKSQKKLKCDQCHNEKGWINNILFDHDLTRFPLAGLHASTTCEECHLSQAYKDTDSDCYSCHEKDDVHKKQLPTECKQCHNPNSWSLWDFDHNKETDFELKNAHKDLECLACHREEFRKLGDISKICSACHKRDDVHDGEFGNSCDRCHNTEDFRNVQISRY